MASDTGSTSSLHDLINIRQVEPPLVRYLRQCHEQMDNYNNEVTVKVVLGNITCDLDSAVSTICYAYTLFYDDRHSPLRSEKIILPVFNIKKSGLKYKTEVIYILKKLRISTDLLFFRDTVSLETLAQLGKLEVVLVDHHTLSQEDEATYQHLVMQVIDHRPVVKNWPLPKSMITIEEVGSCATLIANKILAREPSLLIRDRQMPKLLFCAILLDTMNCSEISKRYVQQDKDMLEMLQCQVLGEGQTREDVYRGLLRARTNVDSFTSLEILLKDVKYAYGVPVCTLPSLVQEFLRRTDAIEALNTLLQSENYELIVLIGITVREDTMLRDMAFYTTPESDLYLQIIQAIETDEDLNLQLEEVPCTDIENLKVFKQHNRERTRKHILPIIERTVTDHRKRKYTLTT